MVFVLGLELPPAIISPGLAGEHAPSPIQCFDRRLVVDKLLPLLHEREG